MDGFLEHQLICRACLRIVENKTQSFGYIEDVNGNLKDMIMCCVPEMDIYVSSHPIMCFPCIQLLITVYNFKTRCLNTETVIRSYIQRNNLIDYNHVNLSCVVQELIRLNSYFRDMQNRNRQEGVQSNNGPPGNHCGASRNQCEVPGNQHGTPENPGGMAGSPGAIPGNPGGTAGSPGAVPGNQGGIPGFHSGVHRNQDDVSTNLNGPPGNINGIIPQSGVPVRQSDVPGNHRFTPTTLGKFLENHYGPSVNHIGMPGPPGAAPEQRSGPGNPTDLVKHCGTAGNRPGERNHYLPLTREEINSAPQFTNNNESIGEGGHVAQSVEKNGVTANEKSETHPIETRMRLVIKIDKGKVILPYSRSEDLNEKENEQLDVEMKEKETPLPENGSLMHPPPQDNKQELYECANCTFVTTHLNFLLAHNTVCISEHEKIDLKKCPHCPHVTNRQYALNKHINTMHTKAIWYSCDLCNYRSTDSSCLRRHKRNVHPETTGGEQLCCHLCAYRCTTEYHLKKHLLKHEENTALQCQFCSYSTKDRSNFRKHIFIHNPKAQDCEFCDYKCVSPYQMKVHLRKYHHGVGMEDIDCRSEVSISEVVEDITAAINETQTYIGHQAE